MTKEKKTKHRKQQANTNTNTFCGILAFISAVLYLQWRHFSPPPLPCTQTSHRYLQKAYPKLSCLIISKSLTVCLRAVLRCQTMLHFYCRLPLFVFSLFYLSKIVFTLIIIKPVGSVNM